MKIQNETKRLFLGVCSIFLLIYAFSGANRQAVEAKPAMVPELAISVFMNEIHYDNTGGDVNEGIEIAGPAGTNLAGWSIVLYNGSNNLSYGTTNLSGIIPDQQNGCGTIWFAYPTNGIQNGSPDAMALYDGTSVVQFLSYEGTLTAGDGVAAGMLSVDIGVSEPTSTPLGQSLQLQGSGELDSDFTWAGPIGATAGAVNTGQTFICTPPTPEPDVSSTTPANGAINQAVNTNITIVFDEPVNVSGSWFTISCSTSGIHTAAVTGAGPTDTYILNPDVDFDQAETCTVTIESTLVQDVDTNNMLADYIFSFDTLIPAGTCGDPANFIHDIQGAGVTSPVVSAIVTIEGIVTGDFQAVGDMQGYFVVEEDADVDGLVTTSEGIFVFDPTTFLDVSVGDKVRVTGTVAEFVPSAGADGTETQINTITAVDLCTGGTVTPIVVTFPLSNLTEWEQYEGMLIEINQDLVVTEGYNHGRFGEVVLSANGRMLNPTNWDPTWDTGTNASDNHNMNRNNRIVLSDHLVKSSNPDPIIYPAPGLSAVNTLRGGTRVAAGLTANVKYISSINTGANARTSWCAANPDPIFTGTPYGHDCGVNGNYVLETNDPVTFINDNPRPTAPAIVAPIKVVSFNVLNYFNGPAFPTPRGADTAAEFTRQRDKIIDAAVVMDADIYGLMEIENDGYAGTSAIADLVNGINAISSRTYAYVDPGVGIIGTDAIAVGLIYDTATFSLVGAADIIDSSYDARFIDTKNRPSLVQTFQHTASGERFNVIVNHLKSKGSSCEPSVWGSPDDDIWQGNCNQTRAKAAEVLIDYMADGTKGNGDVDYILLGDLNGYAQEAPIRTLTQDGFYTPNAMTNLFDPATEYSYVFSGQWGSLDYLFVSDSLVPFVVGHEDYHINADEPIVLDYNVEFKSAGQQTSLYAPTQYRSSDHDPAILGLCLGAGCADPVPFVTSTSPTNGATGVAVNSDITINFSELVNETGSWFTISCATTGAHTAVVTGTGPTTTFTLNPDVDFAEGEVCTVTVVATQIADVTPQNMASDYVFNFTVFAPAPGCGSVADFIHDIQGAGVTSPMVGLSVTIEGIVTSDFQGIGDMAGYFVVEEDADVDGLATTSEGIFVYDPVTFLDVSVGDKVRVTGTVAEFQQSVTSDGTETQISSLTNVLPCSTGNTVTPIVVTFPLSNLTDWEQYEGSLIQINQDLVVTEGYNHGRFGEVVLSANGRMLNPTNWDPTWDTGTNASDNHNMNRNNRIVLSDHVVNSQNPDPIIYPAPGLSASNTLRGGDRVAAGLTANVKYIASINTGANARTSWCAANPDPIFTGTPYGHDCGPNGNYVLETNDPVTFIQDNPRPIAPVVTGTLKVVSFNVLNYFNGPAFPTPRGADTAAEFTRQRDKIIDAAVTMDADIYGLMEIENDGYTGASAIADLVNGINAISARTYAYVDPGVAQIGTDAIAVGLIYDTATVSLIGAADIIDSSYDARFIDTKNRPSLVQTFEEIASGQRFNIIVNHLKSKGSSCEPSVWGSPDDDIWQGNCNQTRAKAAEVLIDYMADGTKGNGDVDYILLGDLNGYAQEAPIRTLTQDGFYTPNAMTNLFDPTTEYSYVFSGQWGSLDYLFVSDSLVPFVTGHEDYHINADEPIVLDYNVEFKTAGQQTSLYAPTQYRSSDHDPAILGLCFGSAVAPTIGVSQSGSNYDIVWTPTGSPTYDVHRSTMPYYTPGPATFRITTAGSSYTDIGVVGVTVAQNYYYYVSAPNPCGGAPGNSNHTGEFDFTIVPGL